MSWKMMSCMSTHIGSVVGYTPITRGTHGEKTTCAMIMELDKENERKSDKADVRRK